MEEIQKHVQNLEIGDIHRYKNLAVAQILGLDGHLEHIVLADALGEGLEIKEKGGGSVPTLFAINKTGKNVLAIAGEYIVGGMQNRTLIKNIYFDKNFEGEIPVRCVQRGRWSYGSEHFPMPEPTFPRREPRIPYPHPSPDVVFAHGGRAPICALAAENQQETWNAIEGVLFCEGVHSSSSNLDEVYKKRQEDFGKYLDKFPLVGRQLGNLAVISKNGNKIFVLDLFDRNEILAKHHKNLINSYALEAGLRAKTNVNTNEREIRGFLDSVDCCNFNKQQPVSTGKDYIISGANLQGSALLFNKNFVYMNLFTKKQNQDADPGYRIDSGETGERFSSGFYRVF